MIRTAVALLVAASVLAAGAGPVAATGGGEDPTPVSSCQKITTSGQYVLTADLTLPSDGDACLVVESSNVVIDGQGHAITGPDRKTGKGIKAVRVDNVTVADLTVRRIGMGLQFRKTSGVTVRGVTVAEIGSKGGTSGDLGVLVNQGSDVRVVDTTARDAVGDGVELDRVTNATVRGLVTTGNRFEGLDVQESRRVTVRDSRAAANDGGFEVGGWNHTLRNLTVADHESVGVAVTEANDTSVVGVTATNNSDAVSVRGSNLTLRDVRAEGDVGGRAGEDYLIADVRITGPGGRFNVESATDVLARNVSVAGGEAGIYVEGSTNVTIRNATVGESSAAVSAYGSSEVLVVDSAVRGKILSGSGPAPRIVDTEWGPLVVANLTLESGILRLREVGPGDARLGPAVDLSTLEGAASVEGRVRYPAAESPTAYTNRSGWSETPDRIVGTDGGTLVSVDLSTEGDAVSVVATSGTVSTDGGSGGSRSGGDGTDGDRSAADEGDGTDGDAGANGGPSTDRSGGQGLPGFGPGVAVVALALAVLVARGRKRA